MALGSNNAHSSAACKVSGPDGPLATAPLWSHGANSDHPSVNATETCDVTVTVGTSGNALIATIEPTMVSGVTGGKATYMGKITINSVDFLY